MKETVRFLSVSVYWCKHVLAPRLLSVYYLYKLSSVSNKAYVTKYQAAHKTRSQKCPYIVAVSHELPHAKHAAGLDLPVRTILMRLFSDETTSEFKL